MSDVSVGFKGCPFCGDIPEVSNAGTFIEIDCCVSMSFQKSDILDEKFGKRFFQLNPETLRFDAKIEQIVLDYAKEQWNTRADV